MLETRLNSKTIADYYGGLGRNDIIVNKHYQRGDVWPPAARSFLIETILLGFPVPKLFLNQLTDVKTKTTIHEIVDGQQRSAAIRDFLDNNFAIGRNGADPYAGKTFNMLEEEDKAKFLAYPLSIDVLVGGTAEDIREAFRRINSYTVPLNAEEKRHSRFQGEFKWFIHDLSRSHSQSLLEIGCFGEKQLARMQEAKLFTDLALTLADGIITTKARELDSFYAKYDKKFQEQAELKKRIDGAMDALLGLKEVHGGPLMRPYQVHLLLAALSHQWKTVKALRSYYTFKTHKPSRTDIVSGLSKLAVALDQEPQKNSPFTKLVEASVAKTNVGTQRIERFKWMCKVLDGALA